MKVRRTAGVLFAAAAVVIAASQQVAAAPQQTDPTEVPTCSRLTTELTGTADPAEQGSYELVPFEVPDGVARIEIAYGWSPSDGGVLDLGVWDASGTSGHEAFRSWAGSRQGRLDRGTAPLVISPDLNERTVVPGPLEPGTWHVEIGRADIERSLRWTVEVRCVPDDGRGSPTPLPADPVDPTHVARDRPGWYAGDFHLHGFHSNPAGPTPQETVDAAIDAGLDIIPVTEYVTPAHWYRLGSAQWDNPDVLIWPGREVITYFGHMVVLSETPSSVEYRVGSDDVEVDDIQRAAAADGALVSIAHPTIFPPTDFGSMCRGCFFELLADTDWDSVELLEVVTESSIAEVGGAEVPNPFVRTAVELWEGLLRDGHRLTAVSGSDDKLGDRYGATSTMVWADELSRSSVDEALRRGHAYVRGLGEDSPEMELDATAADGTTAMFGDTLVADRAEIDITVVGGDGQALSVRRNGEEVERVPIGGDVFTHRVAADRTTDEGPLGTFWGVEVLDLTTFPGSEVPTVVANPIFLADAAAAEPELPEFTEWAGPNDGSGVSPNDAGPPGPPEHSTTVVTLLGLLAVVALVVIAAARGRRTDING